MNSVITSFSFLLFIIRKALSISFFIICVLAFVLIAVALTDSTLTLESKIVLSALLFVMGSCSFLITKWLWNTPVSVRPEGSNENKVITSLKLKNNHQQFQSLALVGFLIWTPLLITETLQIQHSCYPMIHWTSEFSTKCSKDEIQSIEPEYSNKNAAIPKAHSNYSDSSSSLANHSSKSPSNLGNVTGGVVGMAGATAAAIAGAPALVVVGIGIALWFFIRSAMS